MNYYYDTEFLEGTQKTWNENTPPTIDLISIGIVAEDGREYYAISKDFNLKEAWNRYDTKSNNPKNWYLKYKVYWIRENVLKSIWIDLQCKDIENSEKFPDNKFTYKNLKRLVNKYGKSKEQIAKEIKDFIYTDSNTQHNFYGYYSAYDHVALCWLFGKMINLPKGFPMYTIDLKQIMDEVVNNNNRNFNYEQKYPFTLEDKLKEVINFKDYPKQTDEHNALSDAIFCRDLHKFLKQL